jgi:hypothetical protein
MGEVGFHGLPVLLRANLSNNLSLSTLATFDQRFPEGREGLQDRVFSALGPLPALAGNIAEGFKDIRQGDTMGGLSRMAPRTLREMIRAAKASQTGIQDSRGNTLIKADDISAYELFLSSMGISTAAKSQMYEDRAATQNLKYGHRDIVQRLKEREKRARKDGSKGKHRAAIAAIVAYNRTQPIGSQINIHASRATEYKMQRRIDRGSGASLARKERHHKQEL